MGAGRGRARWPTVCAMAAGVILLLGTSVTPASVEAASAPSLTLSPTSIAASSTGVTVALRYATPTRAATTVTLTVPAAWATLVLPQTRRSGAAGYASLARSGCDAKTRIVSVARATTRAATITVASSCAAHGTWTLSLRGLTTPHAVGVTTWTAKVKSTSGSWRATAYHVAVVPGTLDLLLPRTVLPTDGTPVPLDALVRDAAGHPLAGVRVSFSADDGVTLTPSVATSDARGIAATEAVAPGAPVSPTVTVAATTRPLTATATLTAASEGTLTVATAQGGTVSPSGTSSYPLGSSVDVAITPTDRASAPGVMVDGVPVAPTPPVAPSSAWHVTVTITGTNRVDVSYAHLAQATRAADAASGSAFVNVAPGGTSITFSSVTPFLDALAPGDILATSPAAAAAGMTPVLLKIAAVEHSGAGVVFTTTPAELTDAVQTASLDAYLTSRLWSRYQPRRRPRSRRSWTPQRSRSAGRSAWAASATISRPTWVR